MTLDKLIKDIHAINQELEVYEDKYDLLSKDFYELYVSGKLPDEDVEQIDEYGRWAALYRIKLRREADYEAQKEKRLIAIQTSIPTDQPTLATS